jgi:hypothetical protein
MEMLFNQDTGLSELLLNWIAGSANVSGKVII